MIRLNKTLWLCVGGVLFFLSGLIVAPQTVLCGQQPQEAPSSATASNQDKPADAMADASASTEAETCQTCHKDITTSFEKSPHWKTMNDTRGGHSKQGCEACHGPGGDHADDPSKPVFDFKTAKPETITDRCLSCHASGSEHMSASNSFHRQNDVSCTSCHSMHHAKTREHMLVKAATTNTERVVSWKGTIWSGKCGLQPLVTWFALSVTETSRDPSCLSTRP
jgi:hypothetical protein